MVWPTPVYAFVALLSLCLWLSHTTQLLSFSLSKRSLYRRHAKPTNLTLSLSLSLSHTHTHTHTHFFIHSLFISLARTHNPKLVKQLDVFYSFFSQVAFRQQPWNATCSKFSSFAIERLKQARIFYWTQQRAANLIYGELFGGALAEWNKALV